MYLVDTNIISELARKQPSSKVQAWAGGVVTVSLSAITVEEISFGLAWKPNTRIAAWFEEFLSRHCEILPVTREVARCAGQLRGRLAAKGRRRTQADMLIAATAQLSKLTLVTRNAKDFEDCGIPLFDPFS